MKRIIIKVPIEKEKWIISFGPKRYKRRNANTTFSLIERILPRLCEKEKIAIRVKCVDGINESLLSNNPKYLLFTSSCLLEDYLSYFVLTKLERKYVNYGEY